MSKGSYYEKLKDPQWQRKRLEILQRDSFICQKCFESTKTLHVHHRYYVSGRDPWEYPSWALVTQCEDCHKEDHDGRSGVAFWEQVIENLFGDSGINYLTPSGAEEFAGDIAKLRALGVHDLDIFTELSSFAARWRVAVEETKVEVRST